MTTETVTRCDRCRCTSGHVYDILRGAHPSGWMRISYGTRILDLCMVCTGDFIQFLDPSLPVERSRRTGRPIKTTRR